MTYIYKYTEEIYSRDNTEKLNKKEMFFSSMKKAVDYIFDWENTTTSWARVTCNINKNKRYYKFLCAGNVHEITIQKIEVK